MHTTVYAEIAATRYYRQVGATLVSNTKSHTTTIEVVGTRLIATLRCGSSVASVAVASVEDAIDLVE